MANDQTEREKAAAKRRQAEEGYTAEERKAQLLDALAAERQGYVQRQAGGNDEVKAAMKTRIAAVDAAVRDLKADKGTKDTGTQTPAA